MGGGVFGPVQDGGLEPLFMVFGEGARQAVYFSPTDAPASDVGPVHEPLGLDTAPDEDGNYLVNAAPLLPVLDDARDKESNHVQEDMSLLLAPPADGASDAEPVRTICFRVVKSKPAAWKLATMSRSAGRPLNSKQIIVATRSVLPGRADGEGVLISSESDFLADPTTVLHGICWGVPLSELEAGLKQWRAADNVKYKFSSPPSLSLSDVAPQLVEDMLGCGAIADSSQGGRYALDPADHASLECLRDMQASGYADDGGSDSSTWVLTAMGLSNLTMLRGLDQPVCVADVSSGVEALKDRTPYELIRLLRDQGWQWGRLPKTRAEREVAGH